MKRLLISTIGFIVMSIGFLHAQINQGRIMVGVSSLYSFVSSGSELMSLGYTSIKSKSDADGFQEPEPEKSFSINVNPKAGYFVIKVSHLYLMHTKSINYNLILCAI